MFTHVLSDWRRLDNWGMLNFICRSNNLIENHDIKQLLERQTVGFCWIDPCSARGECEQQIQQHSISKYHKRGHVIIDNKITKMDQSPQEQQDKKPQISNNLTASLTVDQLDIEILPVIYEIIRCVEKDPVDNTGKQKESQECSQKILELQKRFDSARNQIKQLAGIDFNKDEQLQKLELLKNQLKLKQNLIKKYKNYSL